MADPQLETLLRASGISTSLRQVLLSRNIHTIERFCAIENSQWEEIARQARLNSSDELTVRTMLRNLSSSSDEPAPPVAVTISLSDTEADFTCPICLSLLYKPVVCPCGHAFCFWCVLPSMKRVEASSCPVCRVSYDHFPHVCTALNNFLSKTFPEAYAQRAVEERALMPAPTEESKNPLQHLEEYIYSRILPGTAATREPAAAGTGTGPLRQPLQGEAEETPQATLEHARAVIEQFVHEGVGCDGCGALPIRGMRYRCTSCPERVGFDLCSACFRRGIQTTGLFNQNHTQDHVFEEVLPSSSARDAQRVAHLTQLFMSWVQSRHGPTEAAQQQPPHTP
eukprot:GILK01008617.1.p1 GENE.GILK01008617.1~~GILK01008617.1.p1  ORF type:complete len:339 (-),score=15.71 GILK01008617.1:226-1242(-)